MPDDSFLPDFILQRRVQDLEDNINRDLALLKDYEDELRLADDPKRKARFLREIQNLRESAARYTDEYRQIISGEVASSNSMIPSISSELAEMKIRLDQIQTVVSGISSYLIGLRNEVLARFDSNQKAIVSAIVVRLDENQLQTVNQVLVAVDKNNIIMHEAAQLIEPLLSALTILQQRGEILPGGPEIIETIDSPNLDVEHKLKVSLPIIPLVLEYEGEIALGSGVKLEVVWNRIVAKVGSWFN